MNVLSGLISVISYLHILLVSQSVLMDSDGCSLWSRKTPYFIRYVQDGDIIIGGIFTVNTYLFDLNRSWRSNLWFMCFLPVPDYYRHLMAFIFAVREINVNPDILPNVTLGYHIFDSCGDVNKAVESVLWILSGPSNMVPNYSCRRHGKLAGVIGDLSSQTSQQVATILNVYGYPQISYGATDPHLSSKHLYSSLFRTLHNDRIQAEAIVKLLLYFGWTWIGIMASDDDDGDSQSRELKHLAAIYGICIEFSLKITSYSDKRFWQIIHTNIKILEISTSKIIVLCGSVSVLSTHGMRYESGAKFQKTLIVPASYKILNHASEALFNGSLVFTRLSRRIPGLQSYFEQISVLTHPNDILLEEIKAVYFNCSSSNHNLNLKMSYDGFQLQNCSKDHRLSNLFPPSMFNTRTFGTTYYVYIAVYAMAKALHEMLTYSLPLNFTKTQSYGQNLQGYLRRFNFKDPTGKDIYFNENGEMPAAYEIKNYIAITIKYSYIIMKSVGTFNLTASDGEQLTINKSRIIWKYNSTEVPHSRCSEDCPPGYRRVSQESIHTCCFDCVPCSEGEVTNPTETGFCQECPGDKWPNMEKNECIYKPIEYLSFQDDGIALALAFVSVLLSFIASIILCIFALFRDTPIVKANNQNLSFILLVAIMLSFLCVFLFLSRPLDITCMLRQTSFGIIFSVAVSALLAKTFMVCIAFHATKPGSYWRKWIGAKLPNCIVFVCSFVMFLICITWLSVSPPFQEMNTHSYPGKIIIQCNEGSVIAFYIVLSYMGFLAAVSFVVAFLARKLPDSFNEAKYITFSMLVFCNVWITFIPAYMSVMGKNTVIIEVFAILASSAGIMCCIFFPKCYIILLRPQLNTKRNLHKASS